MPRTLIFLLPALLFAGQSLKPSGGQAVNDKLPARAHSLPWRAEFYLHDWSDNNPTTHIADSGALGFSFVLYNMGNGDIRVSMYSPWDQGVEVCMFALSNLKVRGVYVRFQRDPAASVERCEAWDTNAVRVYSAIHGWTSDAGGASSDGVQVGASGVGAAFFRLHSTLVPMNSRPPVTADNSDVILHWKFDGDLRDSGPSGYNGTFSSGSPTYVPTPNQNVVAKIKTYDAPAWNDWVSLRAGYPGRLDGTASFSQADASAAVTYAWDVAADSSRPALSWDSKTAAAPSVTGTVFGSYTFNLTVTDVTGAKASTSLEVGAVATDDNGVVISSNPNTEKIFGPLIAFGKNPWGYMDERAISATRLRIAAYDKQGLNPPPWTQPQDGTISYIFNGVGYAGVPGTSLCAPISSATDMTITVCDPSVLDLSVLPTRILVGPDYVRREEIRICGVEGNVLTVCYDGRGFNPGSGPDSYRTTAQAWSKDTRVGQMKVSGAGTSFLSTICPAGPGPAGAIRYNAGTVAVRRGSAVISGNGTKWTSSGVASGQAIRVAATHGGTPFVWVAYINSVDGDGAIIASRPYPADADEGAFPYHVLPSEIRQAALHYTRPDGSDAMIGFGLDGCESDTAMYTYLPRNIVGVNGVAQSNKQYSYSDSLGYSGAFGVNFYGEDLAHRALYLRSGWKPAHDAANLISDQYVTSPYLAGGDAGGMPLLYGGGVVGAVASLVLDPDTRLKWSDVRGFFNIGLSYAEYGCNDDDTRDTAYLQMILALGANFDPDPAQRAKWLAGVQKGAARDRKCQGPDNSWSTGFYFNSNNYPPLQMTQGSAVATGGSLPSSMCLGFGGGTISVTRDSAEATAAGGLVAGNKIVITGTRDGRPFMGVYQYKVNSTRSITLAALWPGDTGTASYVVEKDSPGGGDGDLMTTIGASANDPQLIYNWSCIWNHPGQITLNRPWNGPSGTAYLYKGPLAGFGQQPYMLGMKTLQMKYAGQADSTLTSDYAAMSAAAAGWLHDTGFDPITLGLHYGRVFQACEPTPRPPDTPLFTSRSPGCNFGLDPASIRASRVLTSEATAGLRAYYEANPGPDARDWGDTAYGAVWGYSPYTNPGVYSDDYYVRDENSDYSLAAYKWTGFFFGMGMSHQWPAVRLGGASPIGKANVTVTANLAGLAPGTTATAHVTAPSGATSDVPCNGSACVISIDKRQGAHWVQVTYYSGGVAVKQDPPQMVFPPAAPSRK